VTDIPLITIASDTVNREEMLRPEKYDIRALILISLLLGTLTALFEILFFALLRAQSQHFVQTSMFIYVTFIQLFVIVTVRNRDHFWKGKGPSPLLLGAISLAFLFSLALPYVPALARLFSLTPLPPQELSIILALLVIHVLVLDTVKVWYYRVAPRHQKAREGARKRSSQA
jgi:Mg2+-importing ATPase